MSDPAVRCRAVRKRYPHFTLGEGGGFDLDVPKGRTLGLIGQNGAGKSTLLRILMGLVRADAGRVEVLGRPMPAEERAIKARTGFVSEDMALYGGATLRWHMDLIRSVHPAWDASRAAALLDRLELEPEQKMRGMSRGQQVKAMLLLALSRRAELLVLDEPTAGLDPLVRQEVLLLLREEREEQQTVVFSSHRGDDVAGMADDVAFVHGGCLIAHGNVSAFLGGGKTLEQVFLDHVRGVGGRAA